ncbi:MAG: AraC family transcriptional regulator [Stutzerimonas stutzeri]|nr:MAG: AraC family transcriptional regulator [Stutzerimonas stutzeri]
MSDPIASIVSLLEPLPGFTKLVVGNGSWLVKREEVGRPFCCAVLDGSFNFAVPELDTITLSAGDFVLVPFAREFQTFSLDRSRCDRMTSSPIEIEPSVYRVGDGRDEPNMRHLIGYGIFASDDAELLASLLPPVIHIRGDPRLTTLLQLIDDETRTPRPARTSVLTRLLELVMIESLRAATGLHAPPGLLRGLADERLSRALRAIHLSPGHAWTVERLASEAGLSRSAFFSRFGRMIDMTPMEYSLHWRMLTAKTMILEKSILEVAEHVGYRSASTFGTAFAKYTGRSPRAFRQERLLRVRDSVAETPEPIASELGSAIA